MDVSYFIKEHLWTSAYNEASKPSGCCVDSRSCEQLKECVADRYFEKKKRNSEEKH